MEAQPVRGRPGWYPVRYHTVMMDVAAILRRARQDAGMTLRALAAAAATSHSTLAAYEQGRKVPRTDTLERICAAAGFALDVELVARPGRRDPGRAQELLDVLALADAYPLARTGPLECPVFGRPRLTTP